MSRTVVVLRPEPGNAATMARLAREGLAGRALPLFAVHALPWKARAADHDALILTSANAVRFGGEGLATLRTLPVYAVGMRTAEAASMAGFWIAHVGRTGKEALVAAAEARGVRRALHLAGREHGLTVNGPISTVAICYASDPVDVPAPAIDALAGQVALVHSPRAAERLAALVDAYRLARDRVAIAAISDAAGAAAGGGWRTVAVARRPTDADLVAAVHRLAD
ncbi:uroporphyrinogen-III synthase [Stakelama saccharophila]|uniref:Uroporphyrinogen-III synthase n=1 Tax=Stakelama saccharophila TaxID=3075605 RepID=A0ABZ0B8V6_9SPHN|nr:uroporphyrinogen-III synthase [Stakelama sp. W311]WNO53857.1 uroporphyrinogen-III synthase [Stakelama sp. W311]